MREEPMSALIFKLKDVPDDEADAIRALLQTHNLAFFETSAGRWHISLAAIWLEDEAQLDYARSLIDAYEVEREQQVRADYQQQCEAGQAPTFVDLLLRRPLQVGLTLILAGFMLYFSAAPFFT